MLAHPRLTSTLVAVIGGGSNPWFHVPRDDPSTVSADTLSAVTGAVARALEGVERFRP